VPGSIEHLNRAYKIQSNNDGENLSKLNFVQT
jgi:hypothetical protein